MRPLLACAALLAGCYSPSDLRCKYHCGIDNACPGNLACNTTIGMCASSEEDMCNDVAGDATNDAPRDAEIDVATVRDATSCDFPAISNVDPCDFGADTAASQWIVQGPSYVDTESGMGLPPGFTGVELTVNGTDVLVVAVGTFSVAGDSRLTVNGQRSLIILARNDVQILGEIELVSTNAVRCGVDLNGGPTTSGPGGAGGGGGGGFGSSGGKGGAGESDYDPMSSGNTTGNPGMAGASSAPIALVPLRRGCPGGAGGANGAMAGGLGGRGGGAIQISSATSITIAADAGIFAHGGAGGKGTGGASDTTTVRSGNGGGGAGGAILLEAPTLALVGSKLCANGGGGGGTGSGGSVSDAMCISAAGGTGLDGPGSPSNPDSTGGNGGSGVTSGRDGSGSIAYDTPGRAGGGGGGGVGTIRLNGVVATQPTLVSGRISVGAF